MFEAMTSSPFFGLALTLICWWLAVRFQKKTGQLIFNPVLVTSVLVIAILLIFHIPLERYNTGADIIKMLLGPATAALALNIYRQRAILKQHFWPVVLGCLVGSLASILCVRLLCRVLQADGVLPGLCQTVPYHRPGGGGHCHWRDQPRRRHQQGYGDRRAARRDEFYRAVRLRHHHLCDCRILRGIRNPTDKKHLRALHAGVFCRKEVSRRRTFPAGGPDLRLPDR